MVQHVNKVSQEADLLRINQLDRDLEYHYHDHLLIDEVLTRQLVSFQANKQRPLYRWYKYKEAFSPEIVAYLLKKYHVQKGKLLDPFAGIGTTLFAGSKLGYAVDGIELLPIGQHVITARQYCIHKITAEELSRLNEH